MLSCPFANFADINTALYAEVPPAKYVLLIAMITLDTLVYPLFTVGQEGKLLCLRPFWNPQNHMITCVATVFDRRSALYRSSARLRHTTFAHIVVWAFHAFVSNARNILLSARIALYTLVNFAVHFLFYDARKLRLRPNNVRSRRGSPNRTTFLPNVIVETLNYFLRNCK